MSFSARNNAELVKKELTESNLRLFFLFTVIPWRALVATPLRAGFILY